MSLDDARPGPRLPPTREEYGWVDEYIVREVWAYGRGE
jgi:hypothetical protein